MTTVTYAVVSTNQRDLLVRGLDAIAAAPPGEVLVLDNASEDGSADAARAHPVVDEVIALTRRTGKAENDSTLLDRARSEWVLLLNEDTELRPGAVEALLEAAASAEDVVAVGGTILRPDGVPQPSAWRFPGLRAAWWSALLLHGRFVVQSRGDAPREVDWCQSAMLLVRRSASAAVGHLDPEFFVYGDEVDLQYRMTGRVLWEPAAVCVHHEQLSTGDVPERRIVELHRNRDLFLRKHRGPVVAFLTRPLYAFPYILRAVAALVIPGHNPRRYRRHAGAALRPGRGEGIREAAQAWNAARGL